jgi:signal transduction histidine kinase/ActR/RegA family two-component response regulator
MDALRTPDPERVLVLAPTSGDATLTRSILAEAGLACHVCTDLRAASREISEGAGTLLLTDDDVGSREMDALLDVLRSQPAWSDIPIVVLSGAGADSMAAARAMELLGNVTVLEKPVRVTTLVSSLRTAIRARRRQYQIRDQLEELQQADAQLRDTDRRKDEFLATLAHELRNPLAPIRNALQIMQLTADDQAAREQARRMMERQLGQMVRLIDDLLDLSRITRGKLELRKERVELAAVIGTAVDTARPLIESAGHALQVSLPTDPVYLDADPVRLAQVFSNLLNNAAKYMERGGSIWLAAERLDGEVSITVRDTGVGIPAESLTSIFEMFSQVDQSLEKSHGGLGIGLTLVKRLVEMHGGTVEARSEGPGRGAAFIVSLPAVGVSRVAQLPPVDEAHRPDVGKCRILVADDNGDAAESMGTMLRLMGNEVRTVRDGVQAVEEAAAFRPDMVLLDIGMPRLNGYEAARRIRRERWGKDMLLVALTGWGQDEDKRRASEAGFDRHFTKPVDPIHLQQLVAGLGAGKAHPDRPRTGT